MTADVLLRMRCPECLEIHGLYAFAEKTRKQIMQLHPQWGSLCVACAGVLLARRLTIDDFCDENEAKVNDVLLYGYFLGAADTRHLYDRARELHAVLCQRQEDDDDE